MLTLLSAWNLRAKPSTCLLTASQYSTAAAMHSTILQYRFRPPSASIVRTRAQQLLRWATAPEQIGPKNRGLLCAIPWEELGPHLTQCGTGRGLSLYQVAYLDPSNRLATIHPRYRQTGQTTIILPTPILFPVVVTLQKHLNILTCLNF